MDEAILAEKLRQALNNYTSYDGENVNSVLLYKKRAENFLRKNGNSNKELERLVLQSEEKITKNNWGLVLTKARYYSNIKEFHQCFHDFVSEGAIGLLNATNGGFDPKRGKFSNYLAVSISQSIIRKMRELHGNINLPINFHLEKKGFEYHLRRFKEKHKKTPTDEELADFSGMTIEKIKRIRLAGRCFHTSSLNKKLKNEQNGGDSLIDHVSSYRDCPVEDVVINRILYEQRVQLINQLPDERERRILLKRTATPSQTLEDLGEEEGLTRERIRQLEKGALENLKKMKGFERLK